MQYEIEDNIPVPVKMSRYPFKQMKVGQSVFIPKKANVLTAYYQRLRPMKFTTRVEEQDGIRGVRVWRIE